MLNWIFPSPLFVRRNIRILVCCFRSIVFSRSEYPPISSVSPRREFDDRFLRRKGNPVFTSGRNPGIRFILSFLQSWLLKSSPRSFLPSPEIGFSSLAGEAFDSFARKFDSEILQVIRRVNNDAPDDWVRHRRGLLRNTRTMPARAVFQKSDSCPHFRLSSFPQRRRKVKIASAEMKIGRGNLSPPAFPRKKSNSGPAIRGSSSPLHAARRFRGDSIETRSTSPELPLLFPIALVCAETPNGLSNSSKTFSGNTERSTFLTTSSVRRFFPARTNTAASCERSLRAFEKTVVRSFPYDFTS